MVPIDDQPRVEFLYAQLRRSKGRFEFLTDRLMVGVALCSVIVCFACGEGGWVALLLGAIWVVLTIQALKDLIRATRTLHQLGRRLKLGNYRRTL